MTGSEHERAAPLEAVRVLNLGTRWPGRVAAMLLADQGADVVEIVRPGRASHTVDPLLDRGKRLIELDLEDEAARRACHARAAESDIVLENMRPGAAAALGLDQRSLDVERRGIVHVSLPGFAEGDPKRDIPAWEGVIDASVGVYTNISPLGALLGTPVYSAVPMASAYGGVLGSLAASLGLYQRQRTGRGQHIEVPLADCVMAAMALLTCRIEGQPSRYNFPTIDNAVLDLLFPALRDLRGRLTDDHVAEIEEYVRGHANPTINFYECADGRILFVCAPDHVYQNRAFLQVLGVYDQVIAEGMVSETPYVEHDAGNNVNKGASLTPRWRNRLIELIAKAAKTRPAKEWEAQMRRARVPVSMVQTSAEWLADPALLEGGVTADLDDPVRGKVRLPGRFLTIENPAVRSLGATGGSGRRERFRLAGPHRWNARCGTLRAAQWTERREESSMESGCSISRTSSPAPRRDGPSPSTGRTSSASIPPAPQAGPFATMWFGVDVNQGKRALVLDLKTEAGKAALARLVEGADVVLHNFLDRSARSIGIAHDQLAAINPDIISCQIGAWTGTRPGPYDNDPSFDPVLQAATGIMARYGGGPGDAGPARHRLVRRLHHRLLDGGRHLAGPACAGAREGRQLRSHVPRDGRTARPVSFHGVGGRRRSGRGAVRPADDGRWPRAAHLRGGRRLGLRRLPPRGRSTACPRGRCRGCLAGVRRGGGAGAVPRGARDASRGSARRRSDRAAVPRGDPRGPHRGRHRAPVQLDEQRLHLPLPRPASLRPLHHLAPSDLDPARLLARCGTSPRPPFPGAHTAEVLAEAGHTEDEIEELTANRCGVPRLADAPALPADLTRGGGGPREAEPRERPEHCTPGSRSDTEESGLRFRVSRSRARERNARVRPPGNCNLGIPVP